MPITASTQMASRIDRSELALVTGMSAVVRAGGLPVQEWPVGGTTAVLGEEGSPFNKVIALGFGVAPTPEELDAMEDGHRAAGARVQVELSTMTDPDVARLLTARGYRLIGFENVLGRRLEDLPAGGGTIALDEVKPAESELWIRTMTDAFLHPDVFDGPASHESFGGEVLIRTYRAFAAVPGVSRLFARIGDAVAGGASLYLHERTALLCGAATLPAFRRGGVQSALLHARLAQARDVGCDLAIVTTQPGSKSQENVQRAGFELLYARAVLVKEFEGTQTS